MLKDRLLDLIIPVLPKNDLSHLVGRLVHRPLPWVLGQKSAELFARYYKINMDEAERPLSQYATIGDLFTRKLRPGARPLGGGPALHPVDAQITEAGLIENLTLIQAKGKTYGVSELLRNDHFAQSFQGGCFLTYYLCPTDYHRIHSPVEGEIIWSCHVPGTMWPVNPWSVRRIDQLYALNERIVAVMRTPRGLVAQVMVAATNVGNMTFSFDSSISTRLRTSERRMREHSYKPPVKIQRGEEFGIFHMGSTVIVLYEKGMIDVEVDLLCGRHVKMGQDLRA